MRIGGRRGAGQAARHPTEHPGLEPRVERRFSAVFRNMGIDSVELLSAMTVDEIDKLVEGMPVGHRAGVKAFASRSRLSPAKVSKLIEKAMPVADMLKRLLGGDAKKD